MTSTNSFIIFLSAASLLAINPGPGMLYVLTRSVRGGRRIGYASSFGTAIGGLAHVLAAAFGVSAVLATSATAFQTVKYVGATYLVYLGLKMLWVPSRDFEGTPMTAEPESARAALIQGIWTEILNPKTALFFLAFIPQFVNVAAPVIPQFVLLGTISVVLNTSTDIIVASLAGPLASALRTHPIWQKRQCRASGGVLIGLGAYIALADSPRR